MNTAEWIYGENSYGQDGWFCSKCRFFQPWDYDYTDDIDFIRDYYYCPHCGRKMMTFTGKETDLKETLTKLEDVMAKVLSLNEVLGTEDPVYFESGGHMECWTKVCLSDNCLCAVLYRFAASEFMLSILTYGKTWRCWDKRPTEEEKKTTKWDIA